MRVTDTKALSEIVFEVAGYAENLDDGHAMALQEASERLDDLAEIAKEMAGMLAHDRALQDGCKACAMQKRLADLGVVV
jgi:hypothetical protein